MNKICIDRKNIKSTNDWVLFWKIVIVRQLKIIFRSWQTVHFSWTYLGWPNVCHKHTKFLNSNEPDRSAIFSQNRDSLVQQFSGPCDPREPSSAWVEYVSNTACQNSNPQPMPSQVRTDPTRPEFQMLLTHYFDWDRTWARTKKT